MSLNPEKAALEAIADSYRAAYVARDAKRACFGRNVRFTENCVEMDFPDGTWDTVTEEVGPVLTLSDPVAGQAAIFTAIMQRDTPGFLAVRLGVARGRIVEVEHIVSTKRNLSGPPTPIGDVRAFAHDPDLAEAVPSQERSSRAELIAQADGYFSTLENNTGEIRGARFSPNATRFENGKRFPDIEADFRNGRYRFNERVRDRDYVLVDEARGIVMARAFIDHKGVLDEFDLNDGTRMKSIFREPHTWHLLEIFKVKQGRITAVEAVFIAAPYFMRSPWTPRAKDAGAELPERVRRRSLRRP